MYSVSADMIQSWDFLVWMHNRMEGVWTTRSVLHAQWLFANQVCIFITYYYSLYICVYVAEIIDGCFELFENILWTYIKIYIIIFYLSHHFLTIVTCLHNEVFFYLINCTTVLFWSECVTRWFDSDNPNTNGSDSELLSVLQSTNAGYICLNPLGIEAQTVSGQPASQTGNIFQLWVYQDLESVRKIQKWCLAIALIHGFVCFEDITQQLDFRV